MQIDRERFKETLMLHGVDLNQWPEELREEGLESLRNDPELQSLLDEQERFETVLKSRRYEGPRDNLAQRIVSLASLQDRKAGFKPGLVLSRMLGDEFYLPKPVLILISILMVAALGIGFAIGYLNPTKTTASTDQRQAYLQEFLHYQEDVL
jgi:hypothetical protein